MKLNLELFHKILEYLDPDAILNLKCVNKKHNQLIFTCAEKFPIYNVYSLTIETSYLKRTDKPKPTFLLRRENTNGPKGLLNANHLNIKRKLNYCLIRTLVVNYGYQEDRILRYLEEVKEMSGKKLKAKTLEIW